MCWVLFSGNSAGPCRVCRNSTDASTMLSYTSYKTALSADDHRQPVLYEAGSPNMSAVAYAPMEPALEPRVHPGRFEC